MLLGFVKVGIAAEAIAEKPSHIMPLMIGMASAARAAAIYAGSHPSMQTITTARAGQRSVRPLAKTGALATRSAPSSNAIVFSAPSMTVKPPRNRDPARSVNAQYRLVAFPRQEQSGRRALTDSKTSA